MRRDYVVGALAVIALLVVSTLGHPEQAPQAPTHASGDYSFGGYRAWYDLLAREGIRVERFRQHHDELRASGADTLIVSFPASPGFAAGPGTDWNAHERDAMRAWVRAGGKMADVGITPAVDENDAKGELITGQTVRAAGGALRGPWASLVGDVGDHGSLRLVPVKHARVQTLLADSAGTLVARYRYGRGTVVSIANAGWFENRAIGRAGDARLAYLVVRALGGTVAFDEAIRGDIVEKPWYRALTAPELLALGIAAVAGLLWLAYGIVPLGPAVPLRAPREPASDEFVDAVAALYRRARARDHARDALAKDARRALERAPRTPANAALAGRIDAGAATPVTSDAALVAYAQVARAARENEPGMVQRAITTRARRRAVLRGGRVA